MTLGVSIGLAVTGIVLNVLGPVILGRATNVIFAGYVGRTGTPDQLDRLNLPPGSGIDFGLLRTPEGWRLREVVLQEKWRRLPPGGTSAPQGPSDG